MENNDHWLLLQKINYRSALKQIGSSKEDHKGLTRIMGEGRTTSDRRKGIIPSGTTQLGAFGRLSNKDNLR